MSYKWRCYTLASSPRLKSKHRILFLAANPIDATRLHLDDEFNHIDEMLQKTKYKDRFELVNRHGISAKKLQELFLRFEPIVVHFSGHGSNEWI
jgi:hypothetical protein